MGLRETAGSRRLHALVRPSGEFLDNGTCQELVDLAMPGNRLRHPRAWVLIPIVLATVTDEYATHLREFLNEGDALHAT